MTWFQTCVPTFLFLHEELLGMVSDVCLHFLVLNEELSDIVSDVCLHFLVFTRGTGWHSFRGVSSLPFLKRGTGWHGFRRVSPLPCF